MDLPPPPLDHLSVKTTGSIFHSYKKVVFICVGIYFQARKGFTEKIVTLPRTKNEMEAPPPPSHGNMFRFHQSAIIDWYTPHFKKILPLQVQNELSKKLLCIDSYLAVFAKTAKRSVIFNSCQNRALGAWELGASKSLPYFPMPIKYLVLCARNQLQKRSRNVETSGADLSRKKVFVIMLTSKNVIMGKRDRKNGGKSSFYTIKFCIHEYF